MQTSYMRDYSMKHPPVLEGQSPAERSTTLIQHSDMVKNAAKLAASQQYFY